MTFHKVPWGSTGFPRGVVVPYCILKVPYRLLQVATGHYWLLLMSGGSLELHVSVPLHQTGGGQQAVILMQ